MGSAFRHLWLVPFVASPGAFPALAETDQDILGVRTEVRPQCRVAGRRPGPEASTTPARRRGPHPRSSCQCTPGVITRITLSGGQSGDPMNRALQAKGRLRYQLYKDAARTQVFADRNQSEMQDVRATGLPQRVLVRGEAPAGQTAPEGPTWTRSSCDCLLKGHAMRSLILAAFLAMVLSALGLLAGTRQAVAQTAPAASRCAPRSARPARSWPTTWISASNSSQQSRASTNLQVQCTPQTPFAVEIGPGGSGNRNDRRMSGPGSCATGLFKDGGYTQPTATTGSDFTGRAIRGDGDRVPALRPDRGQPGGPAGAYLDTVTVTVTY